MKKNILFLLSLSVTILLFFYFTHVRSLYTNASIFLYIFSWILINIYLYPKITRKKLIILNLQFLIISVFTYVIFSKELFYYAIFSLLLFYLIIKKEQFKSRSIYTKFLASYISITFFLFLLDLLIHLFLNYLYFNGTFQNLNVAYLIHSSGLSTLWFVSFLWNIGMLMVTFYLFSKIIIKKVSISFSSLLPFILLLVLGTSYLFYKNYERSNRINRGNYVQTSIATLLEKSSFKFSDYIQLNETIETLYSSFFVAPQLVDFCNLETYLIDFQITNYFDLVNFFRSTKLLKSEKYDFLDAVSNHNEELKVAIVSESNLIVYHSLLWFMMCIFYIFIFIKTKNE